MAASLLAQTFSQPPLGPPDLATRGRDARFTVLTARPSTHNHPQDPVYKEVFSTANKYHLAHAALLAAAPVAGRPPLVAGLAAAGSLLFCGSCYAVAFAEDRGWGRGAPVGGALLIGAWAALALSPL